MKLRYKQPFFNWLAQLFQKVSGIPPLTMPRAVAGGLKEVTAYGGCGLNGIPSEYTELDSLTGDGNAYIDTGLVPDDSFGYKISHSSPNVSSATTIMFGCRDKISTDSRCWWGYTANASAQFGWGNYYLTSGYVYSANTFYEVSCNFKNERCGRVDGTILLSSLEKLPTITKSFLLFALNAGGIVQYINDSTVKSAVFTRGTDIIMDLVPVKRKSDNELGMYDRVSQRFFTNSGTGAFIAGNEVTPSPDKPCEIWCNNGALKVLDKSSWTIFTNPTSQAGQGVYISPEGKWYTVDDRGAGCAIPLTTGKQYTLVIHKKTATLGTILRYGQSPQVNPAGNQLTDWYRGSITDGQMVSFTAKLPYLVMQLSAGAVEAGMIQEAVEVLEAQGGEYTFLEYIGATGTQYIQTTLSGPARWVGAGQGTSVSTGSKCILSSLTTSANVYIASRYASAATGRFWTIAGNVQYSQTPTLNYAEYDIDFQANLFTGTINGETVSRQNTLTFTTWTIGNAFGTGGAQYPFIGHIYRQQAYQNHVLAGDFIPAIRNSDNAVGMYDAVSGTFFENAGTDVFTAGPVIGSGEVLKLIPGNDTAGVANLLKIGDYVDTQEILTGLINHQLGIYVFDGTETWACSAKTYIHQNSCNAWTNLYSSRLYITSPSKAKGFCSHLKLENNNIWLLDVPNTFTFHAGGATYGYRQCHFNFAHSVIGTSSLSTGSEVEAAVKAYVRAQYEAGTPILLIYPLDTPQDEVAPVLQTMQTTAGDNTLEITQASLAGLELEAEYKRH